MNKKVFNDVISDYALARPGYPNELYSDIINFASLNKDAKILEIGSGPGQATDYFVKEGYFITGLEIGKDQVDYLSVKYSDYKNFKAICSSFEEYETPDDTFSLVFSATAFHWIDPEIGYPKAYRSLKKGGVLAVFWHMSSVIRQQDELFKELSAIFQKYPSKVSAISRADRCSVPLNNICSTK
jgi:SAM-dependent methyltransferase